MSKMIGRSFVGDWPASAVQRRTMAPYGPLEGRFLGLRDLVGAISAKAIEISNNDDLTANGKAKALREWALSVVRAKVTEVREELGKADAYAAAKRAKLGAGPTADKTDAAGALIRQELRKYARDLSPSERAAMFAMGNLDPQLALAIVEAPAVLSGCTEKQRAMLVETAVLASDPAVAEELRVLADAEQSIQRALGAVERTLKEAGVDSSALDEVFDRPTTADRMAEILGSLPSDERMAARKRMQTTSGRRAHFREKFGLEESSDGSSGEDITSA